MRRYEVVSGSLRRTFQAWQTAYAYAWRLSYESPYNVTVYRTNGGTDFFGLRQWRNGQRMF